MNSREKYILQALQQTGSISLSELSSTLGVSLITIRKDVANLEAKELVSRQHGSVSLPYQYENNQIPFSLREAFNEQDKKLIAKAAATLIHPDDAIALDSGTTTYMIANEIKSLPPVNIVTNSIRAAMALEQSHHTIFLAGGQVLSRSMCTVGPEAEKIFYQIRPDKVFIGTTGISSDLNLTASLNIEVGVKQAMIQVARQVILVTSSQSFHRNRMFIFGSASQIHCIITTHPEPPAEILEQIAEHNIHLVYADDPESVKSLENWDKNMGRRNGI